MNRKIAMALVTSVLLFSTAAVLPAPPPGPLAAAPGATASAEAAVTKSLSGGSSGSSNVSGAGDRLGTLLSGWAVPVLTVMAGCLLVGTLASRNIGASVGIVVISLLGLIFLLAPQSIESLAKGIAGFVF